MAVALLRAQSGFRRICGQKTARRTRSRADPPLSGVWPWLASPANLPENQRGSDELKGPIDPDRQRSPAGCCFAPVYFTPFGSRRAALRPVGLKSAATQSGCKPWPGGLIRGGESRSGVGKAPLRPPGSPVAAWGPAPKPPELIALS